MDEARRQAITDDAIKALRREYPDRIVTKGTNHVLSAQA
jgi:hypothetical protein